MSARIWASLPTIAAGNSLMTSQSSSDSIETGNLCVLVNKMIWTWFLSFTKFVSSYKCTCCPLLSTLCLLLSRWHWWDFCQFSVCLPWGSLGVTKFAISYRTYFVVTSGNTVCYDHSFLRFQALQQLHAFMSSKSRQYRVTILRPNRIPWV